MRFPRATRPAAYFAKSKSVRFSFIAEMDRENDGKPRGVRFPVDIHVPDARCSRQGYYAWKKRAPSARQKKT